MVIQNPIVDVDGFQKISVVTEYICRPPYNLIINSFQITS